MRRAMLLLTTGGMLLLLAGAGCSTSSGLITDDSAGTDDTTQTTNPPSSDGTNSANQETTNTDFTVQAESPSPTVLKITWTAPTPAEGSTYRVLYATREHPDYGRDFWYERSSPSLHNAVLTGLKSTTYYVRICEFNAGKCTAYSNEVNVEVK